jgi:hypothetical protein
LDEARDFTSKFLKEYLNQNRNNIWSTDTLIPDTTPTPIIIWKNSIIKCNHKCWCRVGVRYWHVFDQGRLRTFGGPGQIRKEAL